MAHGLRNLNRDKCDTAMLRRKPVRKQVAC